eukprot:m.65386 g.65386  ORF g.65386 m.65386 type:complete len:172 (-) comp17979_c0_seq1:68-583(-)
MVGLIVVIVTCCILTVSVQQGNVTANASVTPVAPPLAANVAVAAVPLQDPPARQQRFPPAVASLPALLRIDWRRLPDLPKQGPLHQGFQDSDGAVVDKGATLITAFGSVAVACRPLPVRRVPLSAHHVDLIHAKWVQERAQGRRRGGVPLIRPHFIVLGFDRISKFCPVLP